MAEMVSRPGGIGRMSSSSSSPTASAAPSCPCQIDPNRAVERWAKSPFPWSEEDVRCKLFADVTVKSDPPGYETKAHKIVLLKLGKKFMEQAGFGNEISVQASPAVAEQIVEFAYTGDFERTEATLQEVIFAADKYKINGMTKVATDFLLDNLRPDNALRIFEISHHGLPLCPCVMRSMKRYLSKNFCHLVGLEEASIGTLEILLRDDELNMAEEDLLCQMEQWAENAPAARKPELERLLKHIRFAAMDEDFVGRKMDPAASPFDIASYVRTARSGPTSPTASSVPRIPTEILLVYGGWKGHADQPVNTVETYDVRAANWMSLGPLAEKLTARSYHVAEVYEQAIYAFGGIAEDKDTHLADGFRLDLVTQEAQKLQMMSIARCFASSALLSGSIYVVGGKREKSALRERSAAKYDIKNDSWTPLPNMLEIVSDGAAVAFQDKIYVIGGFDGFMVHDCTQIFDPETGTWSYGPRMHASRAGVSAAVYAGTIYVIGGFDGGERLRSVERLRPAGPLGQPPFWEDVAPMNVRRSNLAATVMDGKLVVAGGYSADPADLHQAGVTAAFEAFDVRSGEWTMLPNMPIRKSGLKSVVIKSEYYSIVFLPESNLTHFTFRSAKQPRLSGEEKA